MMKQESEIEQMKRTANGFQQQRQRELIMSLCGHLRACAHTLSLARAWKLTLQYPSRKRQPLRSKAAINEVEIEANAIVCIHTGLHARPRKSATHGSWLTQAARGGV